MHELSLCAAIADTARANANGQPVKRINLRIGHLRQVVPATLDFCWKMRSDDPILADCELVIDHIEATVECRSCNKTTGLTHPVLRCGTCNSADVELVTGEEFLIVSIDLAPDQPTHTTDQTTTKVH